MNNEVNDQLDINKKDEYVNAHDKVEKRKKRNYISAVAAFVLILGVGVVGNWYYQNSDISSTVQPLIDAATEKTLGKAELVDATTEVKEENDYFSTARLERQSARDESLEKLQKIIENTEEKDAARIQAAENISIISNYINIENKIETLVCAKGIRNCIAVISQDGSRVDIIVDSDTLDDVTIMQIKDIAISQLNCNFDKISIIQSK